MARCIRTTNLEVHHKSRYGHNGIDNAQVLCVWCHEATPTYGQPGASPPDFDYDTKTRALERAGYQCECTSSRGCH
ncbi:MAG: hypothetical protein ACYS21_02940 [Planctomycetota bacterium]